MIQYSKDTRAFAYSLVFHYGKFNKGEEQYNINLQDIPEFDICELSARMMIDNPGYDSETTGPDNPNYEKRMFPALLSYLRNIIDKDSQVEFLNAWREGVMDYHKRCMEELLEDECAEYNISHGYVNTEDPGCKRWFGDPVINY